MSIEDDNKRVVRSYVEAFNRGDLNALRELFSEDAEIQGVLRTGQMDEIMPIWKQLVEGYGMQLTVEEMCAFHGQDRAPAERQGGFTGSGCRPRGPLLRSLTPLDEWLVDPAPCGS